MKERKRLKHLAENRLQKIKINQLKDKDLEKMVQPEVTVLIENYHRTLKRKCKISKQILYYWKLQKSIPKSLKKKIKC
jgi:hypothetical protein